MSDNVVPFRRRLPRIGDGDGGADAYNKQLQGWVIDRQLLADWFRQQADLIEGDRLEVEPRAALLVLCGATTCEVAHLGFGRPGGPTLTTAELCARDFFRKRFE